MSGFDPYQIWLDIGPQERPVNYYRLLGLRALEDNPQAIAAAADGRVRHLAQFQQGPNAAACQQLIGEVNAARAVLLDPARKRAYDSGMSNQGGGEQPLPQAPAIGGAATGERQIASAPAVPGSTPASGREQQLPSAPLPGAATPQATPVQAAPSIPSPGTPGMSPSPAAQAGPIIQGAPPPPSAASVTTTPAEQPLPGGAAGHPTTPEQALPQATGAPGQPDWQGGGMPARPIPHAAVASPAATAPAQAAAPQAPMAAPPVGPPAVGAAPHLPPAAAQPQQPAPAWAPQDRGGQVSTNADAAEQTGELGSRTKLGRGVRRQQKSNAAYLLAAFVAAIVVFFFGLVIILALLFTT